MTYNLERMEYTNIDIDIHKILIQNNGACNLVRRADAAYRLWLISEEPPDVHSAPLIK